MVLCNELETNFVTRFGINVRRGVGKGSIDANSHVDDCCSPIDGSCRIDGCGKGLHPKGVECISLLWWVDGEYHALAAVTGLAAVEPQWFGRQDFDFDHSGPRVVRVDRMETRVKTDATTPMIG